MLPLVVLLTPGMGGPHAWALRLRAHAGPRLPVLIGVYGRDPALAPDFTFDDMAELEQWLLHCGPTAVMPNWLWSAYPICARARMRGARLSVVAVCRSDDWETYYRPLLAVAEHCNWFVAVSAGIGSRLLALPGLPNDRVRTLRTFVDRPRVLRRGWQADPLRLLYSGRLEQLHKGVFALAHLVDELAARGVNFRLTIAGDGSSRADLERRLRVTAGEDRVELTGALPPAVMPSLYLRHDVLVMTSSVEGRSNALLEGMSHGCVPAVFRTSGWDEVLPTALRRLAVPPGDVKALADLLEELAARPALLPVLGSQAHAATAGAGWPEYLARLDDFLNEVRIDLIGGEGQSP